MVVSIDKRDVRGYSGYGRRVTDVLGGYCGMGEEYEVGERERGRQIGPEGRLQ
jgi:hypothetical protein